ncbi:hypothetical protein Pmani_029652 [Petrolisthes manimaculis]|uniref:Secreted protein n=1 Tax=Petrolisthes manimaculis TaxID=1843537 RepID=A0AAE1NYZ5_9EUCA|nr:hypothetical protein Pmani_029652 [Petrolisthes manimaculis]
MTLFVSCVVLTMVSLGMGGAVPSCPEECTCEVAPLRAASFVLAWMTSWGEEDLPELHPNNVEAADDVVKSGAASSAGVDVGVVGLHATCAFLPDANLTRLTHALPQHTMVLTILQGGGGGVTVVEEGTIGSTSTTKGSTLTRLCSSTLYSGFWILPQHRRRDDCTEGGHDEDSGSRE